MNSIVLDTGALIAVERGDRAMWAVLRAADDDGGLVLVPAAAIAQAWRDGRRQARLAVALRHCVEVALPGDAARAAGELCGASGTSDVVDASVAVAAAAVAHEMPTTIFTSDADDLRRLVAALDAAVLVERV